MSRRWLWLLGLVCVALAGCGGTRAVSPRRGSSAQTSPTACGAPPATFSGLAFSTAAVGWVLGAPSQDSSRGSGLEVLSTRDGGAMWSCQWQAPLTPEQLIAVDGRRAWIIGWQGTGCGDLLALAHCYSVLAATSDGVHWSIRSRPRAAVTQIAFASPTAGLAAARDRDCTEPGGLPPRGCAGQLLLTHDGGRSWRVVLRTPDPIVAVAAGGQHYWALESRLGLAAKAAGGARPGFRLLASDDAGRSWQTRGSITSLEFDAIGLRAYAQLLAGAGGRLWVSEFDPDTCAMHGCGGDGLWRSKDRGASWQPANPDYQANGWPAGCGLAGPVPLTLASDRTTWAAAGRPLATCAGPATTLFHLVHAGRWTLTHRWASFRALALASPSASVGYALGPTELIKSTDGGRDWAVVLRAQRRPATAHPTSATTAQQNQGAASSSIGEATCAPAVRRLGTIALTVRGGLVLIDLAACRVRPLAGRGAGAPRFSPDGRWLAYTQLVPGNPTLPVVIPAGGAPPRSPLGGGILAWSWAPHEDLLYGLTQTGSLIAASPTGARRVVVKHLGGAFYDRQIAVSPDGHTVAVDRSRCGVLTHGGVESTVGEIDTVNVRTGTRAVVLKRTGSLFTLAGWSPNGRWILFWSAQICSASLTADGWPLYAVPASGGQPVPAIRHMLLYSDFLTWCGQSLIAASGPSRETNSDSALVETSPPGWRERTLRPARALSWVSPSCSPSGLALVAAAGPNNGPARFGLEHRSIWLLRPDSAPIRRLANPPARNLSDEAPRFSADGRWVLFVRSRVVPVGQAAISHDTLQLVRTTGGPAIPIVSFTSDDFSYYDHFSWPYEIDWQQPQ